MNITKIQNDELNASITVQLSKDDYSFQVEKALKDYQKKVAIDGFRIGKAPMTIVKKMYGKGILVDEVNKVLNKALTDYMKENDNIIGEPLPNETLQKSIDFDKDEEFEFVYDVAFAPVFDVKLTDKDVLPRYTIALTDEMIDERVNKLRSDYGDLKPADLIEEGSEYLKGSFAEIDADDNVKEGGVAKDDASFSLAFVRDKEEGELFKGKKVGDTVVIDVFKVFPNQTDLSAMLGISKEELANINNLFQVTISEIKHFVKSDFTQEFFDRVYGAGVVKSEEEMKSKVKEELEVQLEESSKYRLTMDVKAFLVNKNENVQMPVEFLKRWLIVVDENLTEENIDQNIDEYIKGIKWQLIRNAVMKEYSLDLTDEDIKATARKVAASQLQQYGLFGLTDEQLDGFAETLLKSQKRRELLDWTMETKVLDELSKHATVEDKTITMEEYQNLLYKQQEI
ncbi:MAG: trigger factor [Culturomica sp.]|jgi:trigger factor|nr:trigger factor [Culturomica sp.]